MTDSGEYDVSKFSRRNRLLAVAMMPLAAITLGACESNAIPQDPGHNVSEPGDPTTPTSEVPTATNPTTPSEIESTPVTPGSIPPDPGVETTEPTSEVVRDGNLDYLELGERKFTIEEMAPMTAEEYAIKTTPADRAAYAVMTGFEEYMRNTVSNDPDVPFTDDPWGQGQNSPDDIFNTLDIVALSCDDPVQAAKISLAQYRNMLSPDKQSIGDRAQGVIDYMKQYSGQGLAPPIKLLEVSRGIWLQDGFDTQGKPIKYTNITFEQKAADNTDITDPDSVGVGKVFTAQVVPEKFENPETGELLWMPMMGFTAPNYDVPIQDTEY